jgi:hypothetical protein
VSCYPGPPLPVAGDNVKHARREREEASASTAPFLDGAAQERVVFACFSGRQQLSKPDAATDGEPLRLGCWTPGPGRRRHSPDAVAGLQIER